jgi:condensin complex subunit 3
MNFILLGLGLSTPTTVNLASDDQESDTPASRFIAHILKFLLKGFEAKDKNIRFRCVSAVAELIAHLGELEYASIFLFISQLTNAN